MASVCLLIALLFSFADEALVFNSAKPQQLWRLLSAHVIHTDTTHLIGNLVAFALLVYLFPITWQKQAQIFIVAVVLIDVYLFVFSIEKYAGISGLIYAIPGAYFFQRLKQKRFAAALIILSILILYVFLISHFTNGMQTTNWQPLKGAHLLGFVAGITLNTRCKWREFNR